MSVTNWETARVDTNVLSIALIGPEEAGRLAVANALLELMGVRPRQFPFYPYIDQLPELLDFTFDIVLLDLDSDPEAALDLVESFRADRPVTVMVYSSLNDPELMIRCMRAGVREFLSLPIIPGALAKAMERVFARRSALRAQISKKPARLSVFWGAKGGSGVTTLACSFATSMARESGQKVLLIDLDVPFGDVDVVLGVSGRFSTADALQNFTRLDSAFLSRLLVKHESGLAVLAAPGTYLNLPANCEAVNRLLAIARQDFDHVVVDTGSNLFMTSTALFESDAIVYLVSQIGIADLRNANRLISEYFARSLPALEIVLNRCSASSLGIDDEHLRRALTRPPRCKIPDVQATDKNNHDSGILTPPDDSPMSKAIRQMAREACGLGPELGKKKKIMGLF